VSKYDVDINDLEKSTHVPVEDQVTEQAEPPPPGPMPVEELDRQRLLGITAAGRLRRT
jgi:hypothetical protein